MDQKDSSSVVIDRGKSSWSDLWTKEDYWAIWLGFFLLAVAAFFVNGGKADLIAKRDAQSAIMAAEAQKAPFKTIEWYEAQAAKGKVGGQNLGPVKKIIDNLKTPAKWHANPLDALLITEGRAEQLNQRTPPPDKEGNPRPFASIAEWNKSVKAAEAAALEAAKAAQMAAASVSFQDTNLNAQAEEKISAWQKAQKATATAGKSLTKPFNRIPSLIILGLALGVLTTIGAIFMGFNPRRFFLAFLCIYGLCVVANVLGKQDWMSHYGMNAEIWSIVLGMLIANFIGTPQLLKDGAQVEYFIKTGLVLLGADVLIHKLMAIGIPGIFVAWVVTPIVLICTYIFGQKILKIESKELNIVISSDMSVCGTSAAIAAASACRAKKEELTLSLGLSMAFTACMMIAMPALIKLLGLDPVLGGAWIGGTVDSTGAVAAAGAALGDKGLKVAATVKMIQNVLIGVTAFFIALYWTTKVDVKHGERVGLMEIWHRFPKFVLGFLAVSIIFSIISKSVGADVAPLLMDNGVNKVSGPLRGWFFTLAFIAIGLTTNFRELGKYFKGGKPIILYVCGQSFNILLTILMAWLMFKMVFPEISASI